MARTFELSTRLKAVGRSEKAGRRSATAAAAYRTCSVIICEREGKTHDYRRKKRGLEATGIVVPKKAGSWGKDRAALWNAAELVEKNGKRGKNAGQFRENAQTARESFFSFPAELSQAGRLKVAQIVAQHVVDAHGVGAEFSIHEPGKDGDERNYHCHMLMTTRRMTAKGLGEKTREWDDRTNGPRLTKQLRKFIADTLNAELKAEGKADIVFVEHRSFENRGITQKPTVHQGPARMHVQRKQQAKDRATWFKEVEAEQRTRHGKELAALKLRQDFGLQAKLADIAQRGEAAEAAIKRELDEQRRQDAPPGGGRRAFLTVTGRAGKEAFDRQARDAQREAAAMRLNEVKAALRSERTAYVDGQTQDRAALIERHRDEDRQLQQGLVSREGLDRSVEAAMRQAQRQERGREQEQEQSRGGRSIWQDIRPT